MEGLDSTSKMGSVHYRYDILEGRKNLVLIFFVDFNFLAEKVPVYGHFCQKMGQNVLNLAIKMPLLAKTTKSIRTRKKPRQDCRLRGMASA